MLTSDTIAAVATGSAVGAISIIRLSGPNAILIADKIFSNSLSQAQNKTLIFGKITRNDENKESEEKIDECLAVKMLAPASYTGEDTVEFYCHGGKIVRECVLKELIKNGARLAEPGEFTKRAFLNGKIDLTQAESVIDTINAQTEKSLLMAQKNLDGKLKNKINLIRDEILAVITGIMAGNDFPDETGGNDNEIIIAKIEKISENVNRLIKSFSTGKIIRDGVTCGIFGKPNVGKSSLLNALLGEDRAIVTDIPGTTRDIITERVDIGGYLLNIADTAGLRDSGDIIEKKGMEKTENLITKADFNLFVLDLSSDLSPLEEKYLKNSPPDSTVIVLNKSDLAKNDFLISDLKKKWRYVYKTSAKNNIGISELIDGIKEFIESKLNESDEETVFQERHFGALTKASENLISAKQALKNAFEPDIASIDLENAAAYMGEITGATVNDEVVDGIFKNFCIGK